MITGLCVKETKTKANDYFNPFDDITGVLRKTRNTRSIHWYAKTWVDNNKPWLFKLKRFIRRMIGTGTLYNTIKSTIKSKRNE